MEGLFVLLFFVGSSFAVFAFLIYSVRRGKLGKISSAKFPPPFSTSLSPKEVLTVVEDRLTQIQSLRQQWKTTEKVEKIGRYQAKINVPYNLAGSDIQVSFLLNLLASSREAGGCDVEWTYVMMSPLNHTPAQITLLEGKVYTITTLEIRSALFMAQGDEEEAEYLISKTEQIPPQLEPKQAHEPLTVRIERSEEPHHHEYSTTPAPEPVASAVPAPIVSPPAAEPVDIVAEALSKTDNTSPTSTPMSETSDVRVPEVSSLLPDLNAQLADISMQMPQSVPADAGMDLKLGELPNTLNFSPPDPTLSSTTSQSKELKCVKCSQDRDPSFNFCLYCGHSDA